MFTLSGVRVRTANILLEVGLLLIEHIDGIHRLVTTVWQAASCSQSPPESLDSRVPGQLFRNTEFNTE